MDNLLNEEPITAAFTAIEELVEDAFDTALDYLEAIFDYMEEDGEISMVGEGQGIRVTIRIERAEEESNE